MSKKNKVIDLEEIQNKTDAEIIKSLKKDLARSNEKYLKIKRKRNVYGLIWEPPHIENVLNGLGSGLSTFKEINYDNDCFISDSNKVINYLIEGDNLPAMHALLTRYSGSVDVIEIDPPYNTGNDGFQYNDALVDSYDSYKHSKWLAMMASRLIAARELLKSDGLIFIHIDEYECSQLKLLCDKIFGEENFVENFVWYKKTPKNNSLCASTEHEYILCYAKDIKTIEDMNRLFNKTGVGPSFFRVPKEGYDEVMKLRDKFMTSGEKDHKVLEGKLKEFYKNKKHVIDGGLPNYNRVTEDTFRIFRTDSTHSPGMSERYDVLHPITKLPCKSPGRGWRYTEDTMKQKIKDNRIDFGKDHTTIPNSIRYLEDHPYKIMSSLINNYHNGKDDLERIFNEKQKFDTPKPVSLIQDILRAVTTKDSIIVDFFAGSGTTGQAVVELNREDGGNRQFVLVTDGGKDGEDICNEICLPRLKAIRDGYNENEGIPFNLVYMKSAVHPLEKELEALTYTDKYSILPFLCGLIQFSEEVFIVRHEKAAYWKIYENEKKAVGFYYHKDDAYHSMFLEELYSVNDGKEKFVYIHGEDDEHDWMIDEYPDIKIKLITETFLTELTRQYGILDGTPYITIK